MTGTPTHHLTLEAIDIGNEGKVLLGDLGARADAGTLCCVLGANGSGKSTLLRTVAGLQPPLAGRVLIGDLVMHAMDAAQRARTVAIVLADRNEPAHMRVAEYVALGRQPHTGWLGQLRNADRESIQKAIVQTDLGALAQRALGTLSDGERQRAALARALAQETPLLVLDEPTAFLDLARRAEMMHLLRALAHNTGRTVLLSTHDLELALGTADHLWLLGHGRLVQGPPEALALGGDIAHAFASAALQFDDAAGAFRPVSKHKARALLAGHGARATWTARALARLGYDVLRIDPADLESRGMLQAMLVVTDEHGWQISTPGRPVESLSSFDAAIATIAKHPQI